MKAKSIKIVLLIWEFLKKLLSAINEVNMDTVIDLGSSKVKITTFDQKKKIISHLSEKIDDKETLKKSQP